MAKLERWLIVAKGVEIFDAEDIRKLSELNAQMGGGWNKVHQHLNVNSDNKEAVEAYFTSRGFEVEASSDKAFFHPERYEKSFELSAQTAAEGEEFVKEKWAIGKSFERFGDDRPQHMLSDVLVEVLQKSAEQITQLWFDEISRNPATKHYGSLDREELQRTVGSAVMLFAKWLNASDGDADGEVREFYRKVGEQRKSEGMKAHEVLAAVTLLRKYIFYFARSQGVFERPIDVYRVLELDRRLVLFFDIAMYHIIKAYDA